MIDPKIKPYADWMEGFLRSLVEHQPKKIGVICLLDDGKYLTGFYGDVCAADKGLMAYHMQADAIMDEVFANARQTVKEAKIQEDEDG